MKLVTDYSSVEFESLLLIDCPQLLSKPRVNARNIGQLWSGDLSFANDVGLTVRRSSARPDRHSAQRRTLADPFGAFGGAAVYDVVARTPLPSFTLLGARRVFADFILDASTTEKVLS